MTMTMINFGVNKVVVMERFKFGFSHSGPVCVKVLDGTTSAVGIYKDGSDRVRCRAVPTMILLLWLFCSISATIAIPAWGGAPGRSSIGSLVPGATMIETVTIAAPYGATPITSHLSVPVQGIHDSIALQIQY